MPLQACDPAACEPDSHSRRRGVRDRPTIGIGLPVRNGERFLRRTLDSVLDQSFSDFQVIISDNASTDATEEIAREYARADDRISYQRLSEDIGAARNFNRTFFLTTGKYFKWVAHDDLMHPTFVERCIAALTAEPDAVLAYPRATIIDEEDRKVEDYDARLQVEARSRAIRFRSLLQEHMCFQIFGVIRRDALRRTRLIGQYAYGDGVLLAHLALLGRFVEVPEALFFPRSHVGQSMTMAGDVWSYGGWFDPKLRDTRTFPNWRILTEHARSVLTAPIPLMDKASCLSVLAADVPNRARLLRGDLLFYLRPALTSIGIPERMLQRAKRRK